MKERKRIAAERQQQLDALRVMSAAQLREATRAQQFSLLAKIKEKQDRIHAAIAASAKEELKALRAEARKAAGIVYEDGEGDDDDEDDGSGGRKEGDDAQEEEEEELSSGNGPQHGNDEGQGVGMEVEGMVAKEEKAVEKAAAAAAAATLSEGGFDDGEDDEEEKYGVDADFPLTGGTVHRKDTSHRRPQEDEGGSGELSSSDSNSDSEVR